MPALITDDGVRLARQRHGNGPPLLTDEFGGDHRSWAPQVAELAADRFHTGVDA